MIQNLNFSVSYLRLRFSLTLSNEYERFSECFSYIASVGEQRMGVRYDMTGGLNKLQNQKIGFQRIRKQISRVKHNVFLHVFTVLDFIFII